MCKWLYVLVDMGWQQQIGLLSLNRKVSFVKEPSSAKESPFCRSLLRNCRSLLQKKPSNLGSLLPLPLHKCCHIVAMPPQTTQESNAFVLFFSSNNHCCTLPGIFPEKNQPLVLFCYEFELRFNVGWYSFYCNSPC